MKNSILQIITLVSFLIITVNGYGQKFSFSALDQEQREIKAFLAVVEGDISEGNSRNKSGLHHLSMINALHSLSQLSSAEFKMDEHPTKIEKLGGVLEFDKENNRKKLREKFHDKIRPKFFALQKDLDSLAKKLDKEVEGGFWQYWELQKLTRTAKATKDKAEKKKLQDKIKQIEISAQSSNLDNVGDEIKKASGLQDKDIPGLSGKSDATQEPEEIEPAKDENNQQNLSETYVDPKTNSKTEISKTVDPNTGIETTTSTTTDPKGNITTVIKIHDPDTGITTTTTKHFNAATGETDTKTVVEDPKNKKLSITDADGETTVYQYKGKFDGEKDKKSLTNINATYIGGTGKRLIKEQEEILVREFNIEDQVFLGDHVETGESRDWQFEIKKVPDSENLSSGELRIAFEINDKLGKDNFDIERWEVSNSSGEITNKSKGAGEKNTQFKTIFRESDAFKIKAIGYTDWGSRFSIQIKTNIQVD